MKHLYNHHQTVKCALSIHNHRQDRNPHNIIPHFIACFTLSERRRINQTQMKQDIELDDIRSIIAARKIKDKGEGDLDKDGSIDHFTKDDEMSLEYLVKYKSKSYLHCKWINYEDLIKTIDEYLKQRELIKSDELNSEDIDVIDNIDQNILRIVRKWRDDGRPSSYFEESTHYFDPSFIEIGHIINSKSTKTRKRRKCQKNVKYLIKWKGLDYQQV